MVLTLGYCVLSALVPVFNTELYLVGLATAQPQLPWGWLGLTAAVGQMIGKVVFYYAGRGCWCCPLACAASRSGSVRGGGRASCTGSSAVDIQETLQRRPRWMVGVLLASALTGLPPFAATAVLAGMARVRLVTFFVTGLIGRFARFAAVAASPGLFTTWWILASGPLVYGLGEQFQARVAADFGPSVVLLGEDGQRVGPISSSRALPVSAFPRVLILRAARGQ